MSDPWSKENPIAPGNFVDDAYIDDDYIDDDYIDGQHSGQLPSGFSKQLPKTDTWS